MDGPRLGGIGGTYGGSPIACAAAQSVLKIIEEEDLIQRSNEIGSIFKQRLAELKEQYPKHILDVRNQGSMIAIEFVSNGKANEPNTELTKALIANAPTHGLVLLACGFYGNVIRFLPALTMSNAIAEEGLTKFRLLIKSLVK